VGPPPEAVYCRPGANGTLGTSIRAWLERAAPAITQYEHGTPVIMQGLEWPKAPARIDDPQERAERRRTLPRGSCAYLPPVPSPSPPSLVPVRPLAPYTPPPINSFSDRLRQCNLSFPLNAGLGNNPGTRDAYVRYCANN
jgi:hypothetical protein